MVANSPPVPRRRPPDQPASTPPQQAEEPDRGKGKRFVHPAPLSPDYSRFSRILITVAGPKLNANA